jgi:hypothetical protein
MNAAQDRYRLPQMKASDADRDAVVAALSEHFQTGRLTREELDERTGRALTARTLDELDELTADLPAIRPAGLAPVVRPRGLGYPLLAPVAAALAALAIAALVLGVGDGRQGWIGGGSSRRSARAEAGRAGLWSELTAERNGTWSPELRERRDGALPGHRARRVRWPRGSVKVRRLAPAGASVAVGGWRCGPLPRPRVHLAPDLAGRACPMAHPHLRPRNLRCAGDRAGGSGCPPVPARNDIARQGATATAPETARAAGEVRGRCRWAS